MNVLNHPADEQIEAESFVRECRRDARKFPRPHIEEVVRKRVRCVVSKDFISGDAQHWSEFGELSALLRRQAS